MGAVFTAACSPEIKAAAPPKLAPPKFAPQPARKAAAAAVPSQAQLVPQPERMAVALPKRAPQPEEEVPMASCNPEGKVAGASLVPGPAYVFSPSLLGVWPAGIATPALAGAVVGLATGGLVAPAVAISMQDQARSTEAKPSKAAVLEEAVPRQPKLQAHGRTTIMLRRLPNNYTRDCLLELLRSLGFAGRFDFLYFPIDFTTRAALGYAFVNLRTPQDALDMWERMDGFTRWTLPSNKVCEVSWSEPHQGLASYVSRYRNSPLMHESVPDEYRPVLFNENGRMPFPPATRKVRAPRHGTQKVTF